MNRIFNLTVLIISLIGLDQFSKAVIQSNFSHGSSYPVIEGFFNLVYVKNTGIAFGLGADSHDIFRLLFFIYLPILVCFGLLYFIYLERYRNKWLALAYSFILSGAIGNIMDRIMLGFVVDFFDFYYKSYHFWAFNVADACITIGGVMVFVLSLQSNKKIKTQSV